MEQSPDSPTQQGKYRLEEINQKAVLTRHEAAAFVGLSVPAFDQRVPGTFPPIKLGRRVLFLRTSLLAALEKLERKPIQKNPRPLQKRTKTAAMETSRNKAEAA
jgi:hypothetical protein